MGSIEPGSTEGSAAHGRLRLADALANILALAPPEVTGAVRTGIKGLLRTIHEAQPDAAENGPADLEYWYQVADDSLLSTLRANRRDSRPGPSPRSPAVAAGPTAAGDRQAATPDTPSEPATIPEAATAQVPVVDLAGKIASAAALPPEVRDVEDREPDGIPPQKTDAGIVGNDGTGGEPPGAVGETVSPSAADEALLVDEALEKVWDELTHAHQISEYALAYQSPDPWYLPGLPDEPVERARLRWERLHLLCLRLSAEDAAAWRRAAATAVAAVVAEPGGAPTDDGPDVLVPSLPVIGYTGSGVLDDQDLPLDLEVAGSGLYPQSMPLARLATTACWLHERDLLHWSRRNRELYRQGICDRIKNLADAQAADDGELEFGRVVELDEELRAVYPIPFPQPGSWWSAHLGRLWDAVAAHPHHDRIQPAAPLIGQAYYSLIGGNDRSVDMKDSEGVSPSKESPGPNWSPGQVTWVLRLGYKDEDDRGHLAAVVYLKRS